MHQDITTWMFSNKSDPFRRSNNSINVVIVVCNLCFEELWNVEEDRGQGDWHNVHQDPGGVGHAQVEMPVLLRMADGNVPAHI